MANMAAAIEFGQTAFVSKLGVAGFFANMKNSELFPGFD